jgi:hypothetical protein
MTSLNMACKFEHVAEIRKGQLVNKLLCTGEYKSMLNSKYSLGRGWGGDLGGVKFHT